MDATAIEAFRGLADETRLAILTALVERRREEPEDPSLSFSTLRQRAGVEDSGRFNYHLSKLVGGFVERHDDGYSLSYAGKRIAGALLAGTYEKSEPKGPDRLDVSCPTCDAAVTAAFEDGTVSVACENDHVLFRTGFPPGAAADRSLEEVLDLSARLTLQHVALTVEGVCSECYATVDPRVREVDAEDERTALLETICGRCGNHVRTSLGIPLVLDPRVQAFYLDRGIDVRETILLEHRLFGADRWSVEGEGDALRAQFADVCDGDRVRATLDGSGRVVAVERPNAR